MVQRASEWQLVFFTILTQMAVGTFTFWGLPAIWIPTPNPFSEGRNPAVLLAAVIVFLAFGTLSASLHLGRPSRVVFSIFNLRSSWLSREAFLGSSFGLVVLILLVRRWLWAPFSILDGLLIFIGILLGLVLIYGISRLYMIRTVPAWNNLGTPAVFFTTTFLLGAMAVTTWILLISWDDGYAFELLLSRLVLVSMPLILVFSGIQLGIFILQILYLSSLGGAAAGSIRLLWADLRAILIWRNLLISIGFALLVFQLIIRLPLLFSLLAFGLILVSEILGRFLFYMFYQREGF